MKVTGIGGGHGLAATLRAATLYADEVAAVVTVADDGGSSGQLTRELGILPPGDIRNCLVALAANEELAEHFQHRFADGALTGHTLGNLFIAALTEATGDFEAAIAEMGRLLGARGRVYPATLDLVELSARVRGGTVEGQVAVAQTKAPIQKLFLNPSDPTANPRAVEAIRSCDQLVLGPGSLFTSLLATLLVPGIKEALETTNARRVFVCNARMQKGETEGFDVSAHLDALVAHIGPNVDVAIVHSPPLDTDGVRIDGAADNHHGIEIVDEDIATQEGIHDSTRLARTLAALG